MTKHPKPLSSSSLDFIEKTQTEFSSETTDLGNKLINEFSRADISLALQKDIATIARIGFVAMRKGWIKNLTEDSGVTPDMASILEALRWIQAMRNITTSR